MIIEQGNEFPFRKVGRSKNQSRFLSGKSGIYPGKRGLAPTANHGNGDGAARIQLKEVSTGRTVAQLEIICEI